ncbi:NVEALA domain-containing protein [Bacteroides ihuae]|uniref:NVEALA domain-containing protein n=1 Tax=Bacteroides ihuae TaxID=1852362 RepID=UPI00098FE8AA|nr:NVEALA domain-containing protein [Bacteroides ihuae]
MRKAFVIMSVAILMISAGYHAYTMKDQAKLSDLALNNVEALAFEPGWGSTSSPCSPCIPKSCTWTKRIGAQLYLVTETSMEYVG